MQLIDEEDDAALGASDLLKDGLQTLLEFAAVFCARDQRTHVQREDGLILQGLRHVAADNPLRQPLCNGGLADARLADQDGIVLRLAGENADDVADLLVTADDGVGFLFPCLFDKVGAVFFQRLIGVLGVVRGHAAAAADALQHLQALLLCDTVVAQQGRDGAVRLVQHGEEQMLHGNIVVAHGFRGLLRGSEQLLHAAGEIELIRRAARTAHARQLIHCGLRGGFQTFHRHACALEKLRHEAAVLL